MTSAFLPVPHELIFPVCNSIESLIYESTEYKKWIIILMCINLLHHHLHHTSKYGVYTPWLNCVHEEEMGW